VPKFDQHCPNCGWQGEITAAPHEHPPCSRCGHRTERIYLGGYGMVGDEIVGGQVIENLGHQPVTVYSRSELKREAEKRGLEIAVRHVGTPGSDKSPHTTRWT
jgi:hypothetical protein